MNTPVQDSKKKRKSADQGLVFLFCIISSVPQSPGYVKHAMFL
jgi:hypothetical protein